MSYRRKQRHNKENNFFSIAKTVYSNKIKLNILVRTETCTEICYSSNNAFKPTVILISRLAYILQSFMSIFQVVVIILYHRQDCHHQPINAIIVRHDIPYLETQYCWAGNWLHHCTISANAQQQYAGICQASIFHFGPFHHTFSKALPLYYLSMVLILQGCYLNTKYFALTSRWMWYNYDCKDW